MLTGLKKQSFWKMKLYLDDLRTPIEEFDFIARSYEEAIAIIQKYGSMSHISFDHDLGEDAYGHLLKSGFDFAKWLVRADINGDYCFMDDFTYKVHSQNPVGKANIIALLDGYFKFKKYKSQT